MGDGVAAELLFYFLKLLLLPLGLEKVLNQVRDLKWSGLRWVVERLRARVMECTCFSKLL